MRKVWEKGVLGPLSDHFLMNAPTPFLHGAKFVSIMLSYGQKKTGKNERGEMPYQFDYSEFWAVYFKSNVRVFLSSPKKKKKSVGREHFALYFCYTVAN